MNEPYLEDTIFAFTTQTLYLLFFGHFLYHSQIIQSLFIECLNPSWCITNTG